MNSEIENWALEVARDLMELTEGDRSNREHMQARIQRMLLNAMYWVPRGESTPQSTDVTAGAEKPTVSILPLQEPDGRYSLEMRVEGIATEAQVLKAADMLTEFIAGDALALHFGLTSAMRRDRRRSRRASPRSTS